MLQSRHLPKVIALIGLLSASMFAWRSESVRNSSSIRPDAKSETATNFLTETPESLEKADWDLMTPGQDEPLPETGVFETKPLVKFASLSKETRHRLEGVMTADQFDALSSRHRSMLSNLAKPDEQVPGVGGVAEPAGQGIVTRPFVCFAPGTPAEVREPFSVLSGQGQVVEAMASGLQALALQTSSRWSRTATNGFSTGSSGDPLTLTWSIVPDGISIPGSNGELTAPSDLRAWLNGTYGSEANWLPLFQQVFDRWEELTGIDYVYQASDDGRSFPGTRGGTNRRGDIRIAGHPIDGTGNILAYNFFPSTGDMVIDTSDGFLTSTSTNSLRLRNTLAHEHGHGMGLGHVCPINQTKLMEPNLSLFFDGPQHDDIFSAQRLYGDRFENDDSAGTANDLGTLTSGGITVEDVSIVGGSDVDYLEFQPPGAGYDLNLTLSPVGSSYLEGAQTETTCTGTTFNSLTQQNLRLRLYNSSGTTLLADRNLTGNGGTESVTGFALPGSGPFLVRVDGDGSSLAQIYELEIAFSQPVVVPFVSVADFVFTENAGTIAVPVSLSAVTTVTVSVPWSTSDVTATAVDYTGGSGTLVFTPGQTAKTINLTGKEDALDEEDETFRVMLGAPQNTMLGDNEGIVTIIDDDPLPVLTVNPATQEVGETAGSAGFTFSLNLPSGRDVTFDYSTTGGTAESGLDFTATSGSVTFSPGQSSLSVTVPVLNDNEPEALEDFFIELSGAVNATPGAGGESVVEIIDDDAPAEFAKSSGVLAPDTQSGGIKVTWDAVPGRTYSVEESTDLINWDPVPGAENLDPGTAAAVFIDTRSRAGVRRFYRLVDKG